MYRNDGRPSDLAVDVEDVLRAQKASAKRRAIAACIVGLVLVAGGAGLAMFLSASAKREIAAAHDRFATCLVGEPGDAKASVRVRAEQLVAMSTPREQRAADAWPQRCAPPAHAFHEILKSKDSNAALGAAVEKLAKELAMTEATTGDLSASVENVFALSKAAGLTLHRASDIALPPAAKLPWSVDTLPAEARMFGASLTLASLHVAPFADDTFRFVVDDKDFAAGPAVCALGAGEKRIACEKVGAPAAELSPGLRLWGTTDAGAKPFLFVGDRGRAGIFTAAGARVGVTLENGTYGANARTDGSLAYLAWNEKPPGTSLLVQKANGPATKGSLLVSRKESGNPYYSTNLFWGFAAYKAIDKKTDEIRLRVRDIGPAGELGAPADIGRIDEIGQIEGGPREEPHLTACRSDKTTVIRAKGWKNTYLFFRSPQGWSPPVEAAGTDGHLQCRPGEAAIVQPWTNESSARHESGVHTMRCTPSGCRSDDVALDNVLGKDAQDIAPRTRNDLTAAFVGSKLLLVWSAGERGGLRMRIGPLETFAQSPETVILDDHYRKGAFQTESTLTGFQLHPVPKGALLLVATVDGVSALFIDESGTLTALPAKL